MKNIFTCLIILFYFLGFAKSTGAVELAAPVGAIVDSVNVNSYNINEDIAKDEVNLKALGIDTSETTDTTETAITGEHIKLFQTNIVVQKNGSILVKEIINYDFDTLQKHGIYRTIPTDKINQDNKKYRLDFSGFSVTDEKGNRQNFSTQNSSGEIKLKIGDADKLITGLHSYVISYTVKGAITYYSDHDELYWNATGNDWTVPIAQAVTKVDLPSEIKETDITNACYTGSKNSTVSLCKNAKQNSSSYSATNFHLYSQQGLTIVVGFPKNIVAVVEPKLITPFEDTLLGKLFFLGLGLLITWWYVLFPFYIIVKWWLQGRDPKGLVGETRAWFDSPKTPSNKRFLTPAEVGTLGDETVDLKDISATIVDLARRGYIKIEERKKGDYFFVKMKDFTSGLLSFESQLLTGMFGKKAEIRLKDEKLYETVSDVTKQLYQDVVDEGLFPKNPNSIRTFYYVIAGIALFTGNLFLAFVAFIFGRNMPAKTIDGVNAFNVAKSLKNFLTSQERQLEFQAEKQMMFEKLLPFAIAFGVEKIWAKRFEKMNLTPPDWYQGYDNRNFNSVIFANNLNSSMSSFRSSASPPTSTRSTSGFSSGFSGGFSGGGGGGGGGGSW